MKADRRRSFGTLVVAVLMVVGLALVPGVAPADGSDPGPTPAPVDLGGAPGMVGSVAMMVDAGLLVVDAVGY